MEARFLLDANICIYLRHRRPPQVIARFQGLQAGEAAVSVITYGELLSFYGPPPCGIWEMDVYTVAYIQPGTLLMATTRVFKSGNSQAVRLPKQFRFHGKQVEIFRRGDEVVLREKSKGLERAFWLLASLPDDFMASGREDPPPESREDL
jgi:antitoxin VapB